MSVGKDNFIGLRFFDAIRIEAKSDSEETTGDLSLHVYTHLTVSEVLGSYDYQMYLVYEAFHSELPDVPVYLIVRVLYSVPTASPPPSSLDHPDDTRYIILPTADSSRSLPLSCPIREGELSERYSIEWYRRLPGQQEVQLSESTYDITVEVTVGPSPSYQCTVNIEHKIGVDVDYSGPQITIESMGENIYC